jgi:hypothetical protein
MAPAAIVSAIDPVVLLHLRYDLWISQFVRGFNFDNMLRQRLGAAETLLELQLGLTRPEDEKSLGLPQLTDDFVEVPVQMLTVAFLVFFLASSILWAI